MTVSTAASRCLAGAVAVAFILGAALPAAAQSGPVQLLKKRQPDRAVPAAQEPAATDPGTRAPSGVTVRRLGLVSPESVGVLGRDQGGIGSGMWADLERPRIVALLKALPENLSSPALRDLQRRLLLTTATVPSGDGGPSILEIRAAKLAALGDMDSVQQLIAAAPERDGNEPLDRLLVEAALVSSEPQSACINADLYATSYASEFWQRLDVYCRIRQQDRNGAMLGLDLLREKTGLSAFLRTAEAALAGANQPSYEETSYDILDIATMILGGYGPPADAVHGLPAAALGALALADTVPTDIRLVAAERGVAASTVSTDTLRAIYSFVGFSTAEMSDPVASAARLDRPRARALLFQASQRQGLDAARAELMRAALATAIDPWQYLVVARAFQPVVAAIAPTPVLNWFAPYAVAGLLTAGDVRNAEGWVRLMEANAPVSDEAARLARELRPLIWIATKPVPAPREIASLFPDDGAGADLSIRARLLPLLDASGVPTPGESWNPLLTWTETEPAEVAPQHLAAAIRRAAENRRVAETVVLALRLLADHGPSGSPGQSVVLAVDALVSTGLADDARAIALEAAIAGIGSES